NMNRVISQTDAMTRTNQFAYASVGLTTTTTITDPRNNVMVQTYYDNRLASIVKNPGTPQQATSRYTWGNGYSSGLASLTDPNGHTWTNTWDANGNLLSSTDPLARTSRYVYNQTNDLITATNALGITTTISY